MFQTAVGAAERAAGVTAAAGPARDSGEVAAGEARLDHLVQTPAARGVLRVRARRGARRHQGTSTDTRGIYTKRERTRKRCFLFIFAATINRTLNGSGTPCENDVAFALAFAQCE